MAKHIESASRSRLIDAAIRIESLSLAWVLAEAVASAVAAVGTASLALSAFSVDSAVELISGLVVWSRVWRERQVGEGAETSRLERFASLVVAVCLFTLAGYIAYRSGQAFASRRSVTVAALGLATAAAGAVITPVLAHRKRQLGVALHSHALLGDAACGFTCAYMAWTLLAGQVCSALYGWWWVDPAAALGILYFVLQEAWESAIAAWTGDAHVH